MNKVNAIVLALVLALVLSVSLAVPALADGGSGSGGTTQPCRAPGTTEDSWSVGAGGSGTGSGGSGGATINDCNGGSTSAGGGSP